MAKDLNFHYLINLQGISSDIYEDVNYCAFFRCPMFKTASLCKIRLMMDQVDVKQIQQMLSEHLQPKVKLMIYYCDEHNNKKLDLFYEQQLIVVNLKVDNPKTYKDVQLHTELDLVHPILYELGVDNSYNTIFDSCNPYDDVLKNYEAWIKKQKGDIFDFNHVGVEKNKNEHTYEHILIRATNDLDIPNLLIHTYKMHNSYSFYFFDNFCINKDFKKEIVCHYINLVDFDQMKQIDVNEYGDSAFMAKKLHESPILDVHERLNKQDPTFINLHKEITTHKDVQETVGIKKEKNSSNSKPITIVDGRDINPIGSKDIQESKIRRTTQLIHPDSLEIAKKRYEISQEFLNKKVEYVQTIELTNTHPEIPCFGRLYNFNIEDKNEYLYTPLSIVNLFVRKQAYTENYLKLNTRVQFIKYFREEDLYKKK